MKAFLKDALRRYLAIKAFLEDTLCRYLAHFHGRGSEHQDMFFRCRRCSGLVTWNIIREGGCTCSGSAPMHPTNPKMTEWFKLFLMPWSVK